MDKDILQVLEKSITDTKIDLISPDKGLLDIVLTLQGDKLITLTDTELTNYIFVLSQYQHYLQCQANYRTIRFLNAKRDYEFALAKESVKITAKTIKEKEHLALMQSESLQELEKQVRIREADHIIFNKIPENLIEMSNALKKELGLRSPSQGVAKRW